MIPDNHQKMTNIRRDKESNVPIIFHFRIWSRTEKGDILVLGWGWNLCVL